MRGKIKKLLSGLVMLAALIGILIYPDTCMAEEPVEIEVNGIYQVQEAAQLKTAPQNDATNVTRMSEGDAVVVAAYDGGDWCEVSAGEQKGYIRIESLGTVGNAEALNAEFQNIGNDYETIFNEVTQLQIQKRNSRIWGTVIVILVVAIFGVGLLSAVRKNKEEQQNEQI